MGMKMAEDEAEVEALLKQIALAKQKELRLRAEKKRVRDEMGQLQAGTLWSREEQAQKQLLEVRRAKERLEVQQKAEEDKLAKLSDNLREQELKFRRGFQAKPSPLMQAAASLVATTPTPLRAARSSSNQNENATSLQTENVVVSVSMDKRTRMSKTPSPPTSPPAAQSPDLWGVNNAVNRPENDALQCLIRNINCVEQQKRIDRLQVELEKANSRRRDADFPIKVARHPNSSSDDLSGSHRRPERDYPQETHLSENEASPGTKAHDRKTEAVRRAATKFIHLKPLEDQAHTHQPDQAIPPSNNTDSSQNAQAVAPSESAVPSGVPDVPTAACLSQFVLPVGYPPIYPAPIAPYPFVSPPTVNPYGIGFPSPFFHSFQYPVAPSWAPPSTSYPFQIGNAPPAPDQISKPSLHQQEEEIRRLERELEMQRITNEQQAEAKEFARLQGRLQELQTKISTLTVADNVSAPAINETEADEKEGSALRSLKRQHLESLAKVRNERDLLEEQEKLEELKELIQRRREEKKRELDHEEWVAKQKRELVALRLQRAIQHSDAKPADPQEEPAEPYTPDSGFALYWDYAAGFPATVNEVQVTYAVFEGKVIRTPFKVVSSKETKAVGPQHKLCSFLSFRHIKKLPATADLRVVMEIAAVAQSGAGGPRAPTSLGWTAFDVFKMANEGEMVLVCGSFKLPVKQSSMPDPSKTIVLPPNLNECGDIRLHIRLVHGGRVEEASRLVVDPELHAARYELPDSGKAPPKPQSRGTVARQPSIQGRRTPVKSLDDQETTPSPASAGRSSDPPPSGRPKQDFLDVDRLRLISSASSRPPSTRPRSNLPATSARPRLPPFREDSDEVDEPWIRVDKTAELQRRLLGGSSFQPGDGFNVFIDGGRGFPDSVAISKVTVAALHADRTQVVAENANAFASTALDAFDPTFDAYVEYRHSNFNPTLTLVIRVDTIELVSKRPVILGYSVFPVFLDVETRDQPNRPSIPQFILNEGGFQLPLHSQVQSAEANQPLSAKSCDVFPRIPCATLLLRIVKAKLSGDGLAVLSRKDFPPHEWETKGLLVPAPLYCDQFYDSLRCVPSGIEEKIYSIRHKNRRAKTVFQCLQQISLSTSEAREMLKVKPAAYLDLSSALRYEPAIGFRVAVDALHNVKAKGGPFFKVIFSVYPPGSFYQAIRLTGDVYFTTTMSWTSAQTSPEFGDGYMTLRDSPSDHLLAVLFDVRSVTRHPKTGALTSQQYGWTFLPVLAHSRFVNACTIQLPLFQGEVNLGVLKSAIGGLSTLVDDIGNEKVKQLVPVAEDGASLFVRIQDPQVSHLSSQPIVKASLSKMVPSRLSAKYVYDSTKIAASKKKTPVSKLLPTNTPETQFEKEMNQAFAQEMGIHHLLF